MDAAAVSEPVPETEMRVVILLPQPLDNVSKFLSVVADCWPSAKIDTGTPGGWTITIPAEEV